MQDANAPRKGARSIAAIPPDVLRALNAGTMETITLPEMLAIDMGVLLAHVLDELKIPGKLRTKIMGEYTPIASLGVMDRLRGVGALLRRELGDHEKSGDYFEAIAAHRSDMVRSFAVTWLSNVELPLAKRLKAMYRFGADKHMGVRELAWMGWRPFASRELELGIKLLGKWVLDSDENIRRCACEGTRPRGVWCAHITALKENPALAVSLLEPLRSDSSLYVRKSVGNWLNDAGKSQPEWVRELSKRWLAESPTKETQWIVKHGMRSLKG